MERDELKNQTARARLDARVLHVFRQNKFRRVLLVFLVFVFVCVFFFFFF